MSGPQILLLWSYTSFGQTRARVSVGLLLLCLRFFLVDVIIRVLKDSHVSLKKHTFVYKLIFVPHVLSVPNPHIHSCPWTQHKSRPAPADLSPQTVGVSRCRSSLKPPDPRTPRTPGPCHMRSGLLGGGAGGQRPRAGVSATAEQQAAGLRTPWRRVGSGGTVAHNPAAMSLLCVRGKAEFTLKHEQVCWSSLKQDKFVLFRSEEFCTNI